MTLRDHLSHLPWCQTVEKVHDHADYVNNEKEAVTLDITGNKCNDSQDVK